MHQIPRVQLPNPFDRFQIEEIFIPKEHRLLEIPRNRHSILPNRRQDAKPFIDQRQVIVRDNYSKNCKQNHFLLAHQKLQRQFQIILILTPLQAICRAFPINIWGEHEIVPVDKFRTQPMDTNRVQPFCGRLNQKINSNRKIFFDIDRCLAIVIWKFHFLGQKYCAVKLIPTSA